MGKLAEAKFLSDTSQTSFSRASELIKRGESEKAQYYDSFSYQCWLRAVQCFFEAVATGEFQNKSTRGK